MPTDLERLRNLVPATGTLTPTAFQTAIDGLTSPPPIIQAARGHAARIAQLDGTAGISRLDIDLFAALSAPNTDLTAADIPPLLAIPIPGSTPPGAPVVAPGAPGVTPGAPITPPGAPVANNQNLRYIFQQLLTANGNPANGLTRAQILRFINDNHSQISDTTVRGNVDTLRDSIPANSPVLLALRLIANNETGYLFRAPGDSHANDFTIADIAVTLPTTAAPNTPITAEHIINHFMNNVTPTVVDFLNRAASGQEHAGLTCPIATPQGGNPYSILTQYRAAQGAPLQTMTHTHNGARYIFSMTNGGNFDVAIIRPNNSTTGSPISIEIYRYDMLQVQQYFLNQGIRVTLGPPGAASGLHDLTGLINDNFTENLPGGPHHNITTPGGQNTFFPLFIQHLTTGGIPRQGGGLPAWTRFSTTNFRGMQRSPGTGVTAVQTNHGFVSP